MMVYYFDVCRKCFIMSPAIASNNKTLHITMKTSLIRSAPDRSLFFLRFFLILLCNDVIINTYTNGCKYPGDTANRLAKEKDYDNLGGCQIEEKS